MRLALLPHVSQLTFIPYIYIRSGFLFLILSHQTDSINSPFDQTNLQSQPFTMSVDQSRPITQKPNETCPTSRHSIMLLTTSAIGAALLFLSGLTLTGTVISLVIATPVLILFSPILFPTGIIIFLATAGFLFSGGCGAAATAALAWLYNYIAGKRRRGAVAEQLDYARMRIASRARDMRDMRERAREYGQKVQQNKAQSQEHSSKYRPIRYVSADTYRKNGLPRRIQADIPLRLKIAGVSAESRYVSACKRYTSRYTSRDGPILTGSDRYGKEKVKKPLK
ncbi:hypothetical protein TEA_010975 [Camellia sinensis var. sinensis]|uniref:Oleosin n=1 Tax=Camellia sinensis var. sinensis TaxID=542762 RepID=A0A4S4ERW9_CAMSN|nr:hypothetical protein TEA_010975 [Camellia sinensis var. sinensis]